MQQTLSSKPLVRGQVSLFDTEKHPRKLRSPLKRDHFKGKYHPPTKNFQVLCICFRVSNHPRCPERTSTQINGTISYGKSLENLPATFWSLNFDFPPKKMGVPFHHFMDPCIPTGYKLLFSGRVHSSNLT